MTGKADLHVALEHLRDGDVFGIASEDEAHALDEDERDAPGREERVERPLVEVA